MQQSSNDKIAFRTFPTGGVSLKVIQGHEKMKPFDSIAKIV